MNRNSLMYWFPLIRNLVIPVPRTETMFVNRDWMLGEVIFAWLTDNLPDGCDTQNAWMVTGIAIGYADLVPYEMLKKVEEK